MRICFTKILVTWVLSNVFSRISLAQTDTALINLQTKINDVLSAQKGSFAVAFKDLSSGKELLINENETFHAASTMKTPVMIEVFRQARNRKFSLKNSLTIKNDFKSLADGSSFSLDSTDDSELDLYKRIGQKETIYHLVYKMITLSSNLATNLLIEKLGAGNVTQTMRTLGAGSIQVLRGVEDEKAYQQGLNNTTTAHDLMVIFEKIADGKAVSKKASRQMIRILLDQQFHDIIPAELPPDAKVAHKTGFFTGVHHDSGIVFLPGPKRKRKYVLVLLSKNVDDDKAVKALAHVSGLIYQYEIASH